MGRKSKGDAELVDKLVDLLNSGNTRDTACASVGIDPRTLRTWLARAQRAAPGDADFVAIARRIAAAEANAEVRDVLLVQQAAHEDWRAAAWILERRGARRWGYSTSVRVQLESELERMLDVAHGTLKKADYERLVAALAASTGPEEGPAGGAGG